MLIEFFASSTISETSSDWNGDLRPEPEVNCFDVFDLHMHCTSWCGNMTSIKVAIVFMILTYLALANLLDCCPRCIRITRLKSISFISLIAIAPYALPPFFDKIPNTPPWDRLVEMKIERLLGDIPMRRVCCLPFCVIFVDHLHVVN